MMNAGANIRLIMIGECDVTSSKNGCMKKNKINEATAPDANIIQFPYLVIMDSELDEFQLYIIMMMEFGLKQSVKIRLVNLSILLA